MINLGRIPQKPLEAPLELTQSSIMTSWIMTGTFVALGFGLGLLVAAGKAPRRLYVVGTIVTLVASALWALEIYTFILGAAMEATGGPG
jgi:hypothetical protein